MGILNVTPDSFHDGGRYLDKDKALFQAEQMIRDGAEIIDVGGESTRPGFEFISIEQELGRVSTIICAIKQNFDVAVSLDTRKSQVAKTAIELGVDIINDIEGFQDPLMFKLLAETEVGGIAMFNANIIRTNEKSITKRVHDYFEQFSQTVKSNSIPFDRICLDVGIGFLGSFENDLEVFRNISSIKIKEIPLLVGISRKSFIGKICNESETSKRLAGTIASNLLAVQYGADILRVHDVKEASDMLKILEFMK